MASVRVSSKPVLTTAVEDRDQSYDLNRIMSELPQELFRPSYRKAFRALAMSLTVLVCGYVALVYSPWFLMPLGWLVVGTATMGLAVVASDCSNQKFVRSQFLNELVGMLCMVPLWTPFYSWKESYNQQPSRRLARSPFWLLTSTWQWMKANFAPTMSKKLIFNLICVYAFVCIFFPLMTKTVGIWGLFKYYFIPLAVYHIWMSTFLKMTDLVEIDGDSILLYSYPQWIELIGTNLNLLMTEFTLRLTDGVPSYNSKAAKETLVKQFSPVTQEVQVGWLNLLGWNTTATPRPVKWEEKRTVMQIHGVWYDVTDFKHPGGPVALNLGRNRDATALFEAHHMFTSRARLEGLLNKYRVPDERAAQLHAIDAGIGKPEYRFDWSLSTKPEPSDGVFTDFATELRARAKAHFAKKAHEQGITLLQATKATWGRWFCMSFWTVCFLASIVAFVRGSWIAMVVAPIMAWMFAANIAHDAMHFSVSTVWWINAALGHVCPFTASPLQWYHQHVIGHHAYPNMPFQDPDLAHAPAFMRVHPSVRWRPAHMWQRFTTFVVWSIGATLYMTVVPLKALYFGMLNRSVPFNKLSTVRITAHVLGRLVTAAFLWGWQWYVFQGDLPRQVLFTVVPMLIHSVCFMLATQVNHLTEENSTRLSSEYFTHQVVTSHSFGQTSDLTFWFSGGLNFQIEHHLFPTVNHCHLRDLQPMVKELCLKYNVPYHESPNYVVALQKYWKHIGSMSMPPTEIDY